MRAIVRAVPVALVIAATAAAQEPAPAPAPDKKPVAEQPTPAPAPAPRRESTLTNVRIELTLSDQSGSQPPVRKTMSMIVADGDRGAVRSRPEVQVPVRTTVGEPKSFAMVKLPLNVDARPAIVAGGRVKLQLTLEYSSIDRSAAEARGTTTDINFQGQVLLDSGRPAVVAEASDPVSDRKVTVEVTATIMK